MLTSAPQPIGAISLQYYDGTGTLQSRTISFLQFALVVGVKKKEVILDPFERQDSIILPVSLIQNIIIRDHARLWSAVWDYVAHCGMFVLTASVNTLSTTAVPDEVAQKNLKQVYRS